MAQYHIWYCAFLFIFNGDMALVFVDHFIYDSTSYDCYYDTGTNTGIANVTGPNPQTHIPLPNAGRGYTNGQEITSSDFCTGTTRVHVFASENDPFCTFTLEADSPTCVVIPGGCDIAINTTVITNETDTGANDGTITVNASSTAGDITYSKDGVSYQSSNLFTGLAPGTYTIYVTDANECVATKTVSVLSYNAPVQSFSDDLPIVDLGGGNISKWNAAFNPVVINYQRKDYVVTSVIQGSGAQIKVQVSAALGFNEYTAAINSGLYFETNLYSFYGRADSYNPTDGFLITEPYVGDYTDTGFLNIPTLKTGYYVETELTYGLDPVHPKVITAKHSPRYDGRTRADLATFLQTIVNPEETFDFVTQSYSDPNLAASFTVRFREVWDNGAGSWYSAPYPLYVTYAAMQLGEQYGGNMANYVPFMYGESAKFLTDFEQPVFFQGLPFEISFIYSEDVINQALYLELIPNCGSGSNSYLLINDGAGSYLNINPGRLVINRLYNPSISGYEVIQALGVTRCLIPDVFDCCADKITANIYYLDGGTKTYIMEELTIRQVCGCDTEPYIYVKWINHLGAWDYYKFGFQQFRSASVTNDVVAKRFVDNWQDDDTIEDIIQKSSIQSILVGVENLDDDTANALQWMRKSIKVQMLYSANPIKWHTVIVKDGATDSISTRKSKSSFRAEILLPSDNVQNQ